jgi:WD40 repeat protein
VQLHWVSGGRLWPMTKAIRHDFSVNGAAFVDDGQTLLTSSRDGVLRYWDLRRLVVTPKGEREPGPMRTLDGRAVSHAGRLSAMLTLSGYEGAPWHLMSGGDARALTRAADAGVVMAWRANTVQCWRMDREKRTHAALGEAYTASSAITAAVLTADAKHALLACADGSLSLIDPARSVLIKRVDFAHQGGIESLMTTLDGSSVISGGMDGMARIWAMPGLEPKFQPMPHAAAVTRLSISKDGQRLATACMDNSVRVWSLSDAQPVTPPMRHAGHPLEGKGLLVTFDASGRRLLSTGSHDLTVRIWDSATGRELMTPLRHRLVPTAMAVSADDRWLATLDDKVSVWDLQSGLLVLRHNLRANIEHVCFDSDSLRLLMAASPGVWDAKASNTPRPTLWALSVPRLGRPVPEWFLAFAEAKLGRRFGSANQLETVPFTEGARARHRAKECPPGTDPALLKWIQFLTTPPDQWPEWP